MPDITVALGLLEQPIAQAAQAATGKTKEVLARIKAKGAVKLLYQKLNATQKVKTIWMTDRAVALSSFYFPAKIRTKSGVIQPLSKLDDLPMNAVVFSGIVGQGKSILLRYLLGKEIRSGNRVPLLVELRRIPVAGLQSFLTESFCELVGTPGHPEIFDLFAQQGKLSILLDGFDEVDPDRSQEIVTAIEHLATKYPSSRLVVTSRPNSGIENSPHFDVIPLAQLTEHDFSGFFHKLLPRDRELAQRITSAVLASPNQVKQLATTPLLATLMTVIYRAHQRIPSDFTEFYDELFSILLVRHDRAKKGWERKRRTKLSDREIQQAFEAYSYKSKAAGASSIPRAKALELAAQSIASAKLACDEGHFLSDIEKVTCLLQEEGGRVEFLHQSVQEFFAARYIASRPEEIAKQFYLHMRTDRRWQSWDQVLRFLSQIDKYRSSVYFFIPEIEESLRQLDAPTGISEVLHWRSVVAGTIGVMQNIKKKADGSQAPPGYHVHIARDRKSFRESYVDARLFDTLFGSKNLTAGLWVSCFDQATHGQFVSYTDICKACGALDGLDECLTQSFGAIRAELASHIERVRLLEESTTFMGLQGL